MRYATLYRFFNENDIPQFGCGWRSVVALPPGRKWITLVDWTTLDVARVSLPIWLALEAQPITARATRVLDTMKSRLTYCEKTAAISEALASIRDVA